MSLNTQPLMGSNVSVSALDPFLENKSTLNAAGDKVEMVEGFMNGLVDLGDGDLHLKVRISFIFVLLLTRIRMLTDQ